MDYAEHRFTLDLHKAMAQRSLAVKARDTKHRLIISLVEGCKPYEIAEDCMAVFSALKPDKRIIFNSCQVRDNQVVYDVTEQTVSVPGMVMCEIRLYGADQGLLTSAAFLMVVEENVSSGDENILSADEYSALTEALGSVADIRQRWDKLIADYPVTQRLKEFDAALREFAEENQAVGLPVAYSGGAAFGKMVLQGTEDENTGEARTFQIPTVGLVGEKIRNAVLSEYLDVTKEYEEALAAGQVKGTREYLWTLGAGRYSLAYELGWLYLEAFAGENYGNGPEIGRVLYDMGEFLTISVYGNCQFDDQPVFQFDSETGEIWCGGEEILSGVVKSVNGQAPDVKGNVEIHITGGASGIYIGSGDMPEGYNIQIDPEGEVVDLDKFQTDEEVQEAINKALEGFDPPDSGGNGIKVSGAQVGQFLKVKEVDENGVPTAWETAEMPVGGAKEWKRIKSVTTEEMVKEITFSGFEANEIFAKVSVGYDSASNGSSGATIRVKGVAVDGMGTTQSVPNVVMNKDGITANYEICAYSNGAFTIAWSNKGQNLGSTVYGTAAKGCGLMDKITEFAFAHGTNDGRLVIGSTITLYAR